MSDLLNAFRTSLNKASIDPIAVVEQQSSAIPPQAEELNQMDPSFASRKALSAQEHAAMVYQNETEIAGSVEEVDKDGEHLLSFTTPEVKLPVYFNSYDEMATAIIGNVMRSERLKSINTSFFGDVLKNTVPEGFSRMRFGNHEFFVQDKSDRLVYVVEFLAKAKESLIATRRYECPLVKEIDINGVIAYTLVLTPKELMDIQQSYPTYQLTYCGDDVVSEMKLIVRA